MKTKNKIRIITDEFSGYEVQIKRWWFPIWKECRKNGIINTFSSVEKAKQWIADGMPRDRKFKKEEIIRFNAE